MTPGQKFKQLLQTQAPVQLVGTINAYCAKLAEKAGCRAIYLSGAGVANAAFGLPDLAMTSMKEVVEEASRLTEASALPLIVDIDTGFGNLLSLARTIRLLERAGVAGVHLEDQIFAKRCGHRPNKRLVTIETMQSRLKAALDARHSQDFLIIARTDSFANEGLFASIERAQHYQAVGTDIIFPEALPTLADFTAFRRSLTIPILANATEFGKTPVFTREDYQQAGVEVILYPLTAFRAMSQAACTVYQTLQSAG